MGADWVDGSDCVEDWQILGLAMYGMHPAMCLYSMLMGKTAMFCLWGIADNFVLAVTGQDGCRLG